MPQADPILAAIVQRLLGGGGVAGVGASAAPRVQTPVPTADLSAITARSAGAPQMAPMLPSPDLSPLDPRLLPPSLQSITLPPQLALPRPDPTADVRARFQGQMPSAQMDALRSRESERLVSAGAAQRAPVPGMSAAEAAGYDILTPAAPARGNAASRVQQWVDQYDRSPISTMAPLQGPPLPPASSGPQSQQSGGASPTLDGSATSPDESRPNRARAGRRVSVMPGQTAAPMPPPPRPADEAQLGPPKSLLPSGGQPDAPPSRNDGSLGSSAIDWIRSEKGQDLSDWLLNFGLGTMAAAGQPGATALGAMGQGGLAAQQSLGQRQDRRENRQLRREAAKENAELRRLTIAQQGELGRERNQIMREGIEQRREAAAEREESRRQSRELTAAVRASGGGGADGRQLAVDKAASDYLDKAMKPPANAPFDWKPDEEKIRREVQRRFPRSTVARSYAIEDENSKLDAALAELQRKGANLSPQERARREQAMRADFERRRREIMGE